MTSDVPSACHTVALLYGINLCLKEVVDKRGTIRCLLREIVDETLSFFAKGGGVFRRPGCPRGHEKDSEVRVPCTGTTEYGDQSKLRREENDNLEGEHILNNVQAGRMT